MRYTNSDVSGCCHRERNHVQNECRAIVGGARAEGGIDKRSRAITGRTAFAKNIRDVVIWQEPVHTIAAQQEAIMQRERLCGIVEAYLILDTQRGKECRAAQSQLPGRGRGSSKSGGRLEACSSACLRHAAHAQCGHAE